MTERAGRDGAGAGRRRRRRVVVAAALVAGAVVVFVLVWFQPQKLLIDERVDEAVPTGIPPARPAQRTRVGDGDAGAPAPSGPAERARGDFVSLDHGTSGVARVLDLGDGRRVLRLEELDTDNGPDLFVYLTANPAAGDEGAFDDDYVDLGRLKGNQGNQNYAVPVGADLSRYPTVVIWCDRFDSAFGAADLS